MRKTLAVLGCALLTASAALGQSPFRLGFEAPSKVDGNPGNVLEVDCFATLEQPAGVPGAQGWCLAIQAVNGDITGISIDGTAVAKYMQGGFETSELTTGPGNEGAVSCVVLSNNPAVTLPPAATTRVASITLALPVGPDCVKARLVHAPSLRQENGTVVENTVTQAGQTRTPALGSRIIDISPFGAQCHDANPNGDIKAGAWNLLFPLTNPNGCDAGGPSTMRKNQVAPRDLGKETPVAGEEWPPGADIGFQTDAVATGFEAGGLYSAAGLSGDPVWVSLEFLGELLPEYFGAPGGCDLPRLHDCEAVFLQQIADRLNDACEGFAIPGISSDNVLAISQTYVENTTTAPYCADICLTADDSIQVWVNDKILVNRSQCAGMEEDCSDAASAVLDPGVNKITVLCWDGAGDWGFRLALKDPETHVKLSNSNQGDIVFFGTDPTGASPGTNELSVLRSVENPDCCPVSGPVEVMLRGNGRGSGTVMIDEIYPGPPFPPISGISNGGTLSFTKTEARIHWNVAAPLLGSTGVTYSVLVPPGSTAAPAGVVNGCEAVLGATEVKGSWPSTGPIGALDDSHDIGTAEDLATGPGSVGATAGADGTEGTPDDVYTMRGSGVDVWDGGDSFHFAYRSVQGDFQATVRVTNRVFPAAGGRWGRYGLMARRDCDPASRYSLVHANLEADPGPNADHPRGDAVFHQFRRSHRSAAPNANMGLQFPDPDGNGPQLLNQPNFFRLVRRGPVVTSYASFDGIAWKLVGSDTWYGLRAGDSLLVGFIYSKHSTASESGAITFTDFRIEPPPAPEIFDNESGSVGRVIYRNNFNAVPNGQLPAGLRANCAGDCGGFSPRVVNGRLRLTQEGAANLATSVFLEDVPVPIGSGAVIVEYTVYMSHSGITRQPPIGDPNPGDGITMTLLAGSDPTRLGLGGGGLGYQGINGTFATAGPSVAVEHDTWSAAFFNEGTGSPTNDGAWHLGINAGGSTHCVALNHSSLPDAFRSSGIRHRVVYTSDGKVSVFILGGPGEGGGGGVEEQMPEAEGNVEPLNSQGDSTGVVGFTGGTGSATQNSEVDDINVIVVDCTDTTERAFVSGQRLARPGSLVILDASASDAGAGDAGESLTFAWSVSGLAQVEGEMTGPKINLRMGSPVGDGEAVGRVAVDDKRCESPASAIAEHRITITDKATNWVAYDGNSDGDLNISDPIAHLNYLFSGGTAPACPEAMDFNGDAREDISDPLSCLNYLFSSGAPPAGGEGCQLYLFCGLSGHCP